MNGSVVNLLMKNKKIRDFFVGKKMDKEEYEESKNFFENKSLYDLNVRGLELEIYKGGGSILSVGKEAERELAKMGRVSYADIIQCGRLGYNKSKGEWECHSNMSMTNEHEDYWGRDGSRDEGRGYYIKTSDKIIIIIKSNDEKNRNRTMCEILENMGKMKMGNTIKTIMKNCVFSAYEASERGENLEERNEIFRKYLISHKGLTKTFLEMQGQYIKELIKEKILKKK